MIADFVDKPEILEAFRLINGVPGIAEAVIRWYGPIRATAQGFVKDENYDGPTPLEIVRPLLSVSPGQQRMALQYLTYSQDGAPTGEADATLSELSNEDDYERILAWGERTPWAQKFAREWRDFREAMLPFYEDMRYIDHEQAAVLKQFRRLPVTRPLRDRRGVFDQSPVDLSPGRDIGSALFGSLTSDIYRAVRAKALFTFWVYTLPLGDEITLQEVDRFNQDESDESCEMVRFEDEEGRTHAYQAKDDLVRLMIGSLHRPPSGFLLRLLIGVKNLMAALVTADPTFVLRNSTRDTLSSFVLGRAWMVPVVDTLRGTAGFSLASEHAREWFLQGGAASTLIETAADDPENAEPMTAFATPKRFKRYMRSCRRAYNFVTAPARALEAGTRIMQFRRMLGSGATPRQAALASRAVATDFANRGAADDLVTFVIRTTVFLNAAIQGLNETRKVALTRSGMGGKTRFWGDKAPKFWCAGVLGLTTLAAAAWHHSTSTAVNRENYEALPTYDKSAYLHFTGVSGPQGHLRIPVPFEVGFLFQKVPEMAFDALAGLDTSDTDPIARGFLPPTARQILQTSFLLTGIPIPSAFAPAFDHLRNRNFFGSEVVPYYMMRRPPSARYFRSTPSTYVSAGEQLNLSPLVIKHYLEGYGGNAARNAIAFAEWLAWDEDMKGPRAFPTGRLRLTGAAAFSARPFRSRSRWADDYYALAETVGHKCYTVKRLSGQRLIDFVRKNRDMLQLCDLKTGVDKLVRPFGRTVHTLGFVNPGLSQTAKENFIRRYYRQRDLIYKRVYITARNKLEGGR